MLSAIFGNILGYSTKVEEPIEEEVANQLKSEASTQTSDNKSTSTQVNLDTSHYNNETQSKSCQDWVIVDDIAENEKACGEDVEMSQAQSEAPVTAQANEDPLIGSFFQRNEVDESMPSHSEPSDKTVETQTVLLPAKKETWLITPLPCLTSITEGSQQQKSMIDNDPLENLLIEQPTRFMSTSTTVENSTTTATKTTPKRRSHARKQQKSSAAEEVMQSVITAC